MDSKEFGKRIREIRRGKDITQEELGNKTGFSKSYLSIIENGRQGLPQPETLKKLADGLDVEYEYMLFLAGIIDEDIYKKREQIRKDIELRRSMMEDNRQDIVEYEATINKLQHEWEKLRQTTTDSVYDEDNQELLQKIKDRIDWLQGMFYSAATVRQKLEKEIDVGNKELQELNRLIHEREIAKSKDDKGQIQKDIDKVTSSLVTILQSELDLKDDINIPKQDLLVFLNREDITFYGNKINKRDRMQLINAANIILKKYIPDEIEEVLNNKRDDD